MPEAGNLLRDATKNVHSALHVRSLQSTPALETLAAMMYTVTTEIIEKQDVKHTSGLRARDHEGL